MAKVTLRLDRKGVGNVLRSPPVRRAVTNLASRIASRVDADGAEVVMRPYTTDRAAAAVVIADVRGVELQAKHGALTKAAAAAGAEVTPS